MAFFVKIKNINSLDERIIIFIASVFPQSGPRLSCCLCLKIVYYGSRGTIYGRQVFEILR